jgi:hypothetical protein
MANLAERITGEQRENIHHEGIQVPSSGTPFISGPDEQQFFKTLEETVQRGIVPVGYGVTPEEWEAGSYPRIEEMSIGKRRRKTYISLSTDVWLERAIFWVQGLNVLTQFMG